MTTATITPQCPVCHSSNVFEADKKARLSKGYCIKCHYKSFWDEFELAGEASASWDGNEFDKDRYYAQKQGW